MLVFNQPTLIGNEFKYMHQAIENGKISGNGFFTQACHNWFQKKYLFPKCLLTTSCTDALEMAALLCDFKEGDEIIIPSFTFSSCATAFIMHGAKIVFADCNFENPNISVESILSNISLKTKAVLIVHYAGIACEIDLIKDLCDHNNFILIEDCAHAFDGFSGNKPLGSFGRFSTFSFHETKNVHCGEGGMLVLNQEKDFRRAEIIWEKGTNRVAYQRGEVQKYNWVDIGSSYLLSELQAAYLFAQLEKSVEIQTKRKMLANKYVSLLRGELKSKVFRIPANDFLQNQNGSIFYLIFENEQLRNKIINYLLEKKILAVFHYLPLHLSSYYLETHAPKNLPNAERFSNTLLRLPLHFNLTTTEIEFISATLLECTNT